jgi:hypothetical protein
MLRNEALMERETLTEKAALAFLWVNQNIPVLDEDPLDEADIVVEGDEDDEEDC